MALSSLLSAVEHRRPRGRRARPHCFLEVAMKFKSKLEFKTRDEFASEDDWQEYVFDLLNSPEYDIICKALDAYGFMVVGKKAALGTEGNPRPLEYWIDLWLKQIARPVDLANVQQRFERAIWDIRGKAPQEVAEEMGLFTDREVRKGR